MRRHLTALFVVFHLLAVGVLSIPAPPPGLRGDRRNADTDEAIAAWADAAATLGLPRQGSEQALRTIAPVWGRVLSAMKAPFRPYAQTTGAEQSWRMFGSVPATSARFEIDVRVDGAWQPLYRPQGASNWNGRLLRQERMRAALHRHASRGHRTAYRALVDHLAADPTWVGQDLRVQMRRVRIPDPASGGPLTGEGSFWTELRPR